MQEPTSSLPLQPMHLPPAPSWFPLAWGWWCLAGGIIGALLLFWWQIKRRQKRLAPKKAALRLLATSHTPSSAMELLRQAALGYLPRKKIASLTGTEWYAFLDSALAVQLFEPNQAQWQQALYSKEPPHNVDSLVQHCVQWVNEALPPSAAFLALCDVDDDEENKEAAPASAYESPHSSSSAESTTASSSETAPATSYRLKGE